MMKNIIVDFNKTNGFIKPLNGVNNGLFNYDFSMSNVEHLKDLGVPFIRFHNAEPAFITSNFIDINRIFPDFEADANNPASYDFRCADVLLKAAVDCGAEVIFRLGVSPEREAGEGKMPARYINPPKNYMKWATICEHIVKHYNEGWSDGFHYGIQYWEIWNEPENPDMWTGTKEEFYELYSTASKQLRKNCEGIRIGGPGSIGFGKKSGVVDSDGNSYMEGLLHYAKNNDAPFDFFDFHIYSGAPEHFHAYPEIARKLCAKCGFPDAEILVDEWNVGNPEEIGTSKHASMVAGALVNMQNSPTHIAAYYNAAFGIGLTDYNGLFLLDGGKLTKRPAYYTFRIFHEISKLQYAVGVNCDSTLYALASANGNEGALMVSNYGSDAGEICVDVSGFAAEKYTDAEIYILDDDGYRHDRHERLTASDFKLFIHLKENSVLYINLKK